MKRTILLSTLVYVIVPLVITAQIQNSRPCIPNNQLKELRLPDVTILNFETLNSDTVKSPVPWVPTLVISVPFCRVSGRISSEINFELLLPQKWNGIFLMAGGGGFSGSIQNDLLSYLNEGYAIVATDTGHKGDGLKADWALNNMERQLNFGRLAIHRVAVVSKSIIHSYYCSDPAYSYFKGCSRGGGQAMVEAQFYPDDFNGIVAGAPAFVWPAGGAKYIQECQQIYPDPKELTPVITADNLKWLGNYVLQQFDNIDGISDKIINDPRSLKVDFSKLPPCPNDEPGANCFTKNQISAIKSVYDPLVVDNKEVYPGFPVGLEGENGSWDLWISGTSPFLQKAPSFHFMFGTNLFKYLIFNDASWDYSKYNFKNYYKETQYASSFLDATRTDYGDFKKAKGKMIMSHGWNDPALSAYATINHYEEAMTKDKELQSYIRLFLLPGVLHCGSGTGPDDFDWVKQIRDWVENDKAPERLVLSKSENGKVVMTRPVFPYPKITVYGGKGDTNKEENFRAK